MARGQGELLDESPLQNFNKHSTHPNPWKPPGYYECAFGIYHPFRLYANSLPVHRRNYEFLQDEPLSQNLQRGAYVGLKFGLANAAYDMVLINKITEPRLILSRTAYLSAPWIASITGYIGARHLLSNTFAKDPKNDYWPYVAAGFVPAMIRGAFTKSFAVFMRTSTFCCTIAYFYTNWAFHNYGGPEFMAIPYEYEAEQDKIRLTYNDPINKWARVSTRDPEKLLKQPETSNFLKRIVYDETKLEPGWKKWISEEELKRSPPVTK